MKIGFLLPDSENFGTKRYKMSENFETALQELRLTLHDVSLPWDPQRLFCVSGRDVQGRLFMSQISTIDTIQSEVINKKSEYFSLVFGE